MSLAAFLHYCTDPDVTLGNDSLCPLVVHYWADLQLITCPGFATMATCTCKYNTIGRGCNVNAHQLTLMLFGKLSVKFTLTLFSQLPIKSNKTCTECKMLPSTCTCSLGWVIIYLLYNRTHGTNNVKEQVYSKKPILITAYYCVK